MLNSVCQDHVGLHRKKIGVPDWSQITMVVVGASNFLLEDQRDKDRLVSALLCCFLRQETLLHNYCLSSPRCTNEYCYLFSCQRSQVKSWLCGLILLLV